MKVCAFYFRDTWLNMGCVNNKWVCFLAELQLPNVPQVKKANTQWPFGIKLCDFDSDCIGRSGEIRMC